MKRTILVRGYVSKNGQVSVYYADDKKLKDASDVSLCAENLPEDQPIRAISIQVEIDVDELFKDMAIASKAVAAGDILPPILPEPSLGPPRDNPMPPRM